MLCCYSSERMSSYGVHNVKCESGRFKIALVSTFAAVLQSDLIVRLFRF